MFVMGNFLEALAFLVKNILDIYCFIIFVKVVISWFSPDPFNPLFIFLNRITEPVLEPVRRRLPAMPVDISPLIVILGLNFLNRFLGATLLELASRMG